MPLILGITEHQVKTFYKEVLISIFSCLASKAFKGNCDRLSVF